MTTSSLPEPFQTHRAYRITTWYRAPWRQAFRRGRTITILDDADVLSSYDPTTWRHRVMLDIDVESWRIPSTTPGHAHLYFGPTVTWRQYKRVIRAMCLAGLVEEKFYRAACGAHMGMLRLPWVKKTAAFAAAEVSDEIREVPR